MIRRLLNDINVRKALVDFPIMLIFGWGNAQVVGYFFHHWNHYGGANLANTITAVISEYAILIMWEARPQSLTDHIGIVVRRLQKGRHDVYADAYDGMLRLKYVNKATHTNNFVVLEFEDALTLADNIRAASSWGMTMRRPNLEMQDDD